MKSFETNAQYTSLFHLMVKHKVQSVLWDVLAWLENEKELKSVRDVLSYIRLFTDFGDNIQGRLFVERIKRQPVLKLILPDIASRLVSRGRTTSTAWLEELGLYIQDIHKTDPAHGLEDTERE